LIENRSGQVDSWQVIIESGSQSPADLLSELGDVDLAASGISVERRVPPVVFRGADPAIIVATIGAVSANLTALITGLLHLRAGLRAGRESQQISIEFSSGDKVVIPADMPAAERERLVETLAGKKPTRLILP
jgi:hypothetical protein